MGIPIVAGLAVFFRFDLLEEFISCRVGPEMLDQECPAGLEIHVHETLAGNADEHRGGVRGIVAFGLDLA